VGPGNWEDDKIVLPDAAGTGSAFGSGSSRLDYDQNGALLGTVNVSDAFTADQGFFAFGGAVWVVSTTSRLFPCPSLPVPCCSSSSLGLLVLRRRRV